MPTTPPIPAPEAPIPPCRLCAAPARGPSYGGLCEDCWVGVYAKDRAVTEAPRDRRVKLSYPRKGKGAGE